MRVLALFFPRLGIQILRGASPEHAGRPTGLLSGEGDGALLAAVSVEATASGVEPGMTALQARQRCPAIAFERDNAGACLDQLEAVAAILRTRATTSVAIVSRNAIALSLEGLESRFADEMAAAQGILALARSWSGLDVRAAVASSVDAAVCAASKARRFPVISDGPGGEIALPAYESLSAAFAWDAPTTADLALARLGRMVASLRPVMAVYNQSYRSVRLEVERHGRSTAHVLRAREPFHLAEEAMALLRSRFGGELEGATAIRVTLQGAGPAVSVEPWRAPVATVHELSAPAVPVQRRLLRAS